MVSTADLNRRKEQIADSLAAYQHSPDSWARLQRELTHIDFELRMRHREAVRTVAATRR